MKSLQELENKVVCVATSGGMDSTALLHYLKSQEDTYGYTLSAVHCEHGIRGLKSIMDMRFVQKMCKKWDIPLYIFRENCKKKAQTEKTSLETAARNFRYECFQSLRMEGKADCIATAHHARDEAETVLFRLARGASLSGVAAMHAEREDIVRPFLEWSKRRIFAYVKKHKLAYREDKSNQNTAYTRNALRLRVLPTLDMVIPGATENIARFSARVAEDDEYLYRQSVSLLSQNEEGFVVAFSKERPLFSRASLLAMKRLGIMKNYTQAHLDGVYNLQDSERGACITLPQSVVAEKTEKGILFYLKNDDVIDETAEEQPFSLDGFDGGKYKVNVSQEEPTKDTYVGKVLRVDANKIPKDATFRFRKEGDEIEKFGGGRKTLKKYYNEEKIPVKTRACLPLIASGKNGEVYVVCGYEIADKLKVTAKTKKVLYITITEA
ncbi:MAG: tRNA lysidine(34) synthetase TilS [Clostridiales bacterium]|nr:tRNA lysidine(34) synthetase TilS [Clostridiales bacterium]